MHKYHHCNEHFILSIIFIVAVITLLFYIVAYRTFYVVMGILGWKLINHFLKNYPK